MKDIWIGALKIKLLEEQTPVAGGDEVHGYSEDIFNIDGDDWIVVLKQDLHPRAKALTLLHELLHVADESMELDLGEGTIRKLEQWFGGLCRQNQDLVTRMVGDLSID